MLFTFAADCDTIKNDIRNKGGNNKYMNDTPDYTVEYAAMSHEIYELTRKLEEKKKEFIEYKKIDVHDPFSNPTEFRWYRDDYSEILPWVTMPDFVMPFEPVKEEKAAIRRYYNIGGFTMLFQFLGSSVLAMVLMLGIEAILNALNPNAAEGAISHYMEKGSIFSAINLVTYLIANVGFAFIGLKWAKIKPDFMLRTKDYRFHDAIEHCLAGIFIWYSAAIISGGIDNVFSKYGYSTDVLDDDYAQTGLGFAVLLIYSCIIAPLTEELFFRGALMKIFSMANQRFGIVMSAVFFGLAHGNIPQFVLAFLIGIFFGHIDMKHDSIVPSVIVHMLINILATITGEISDNEAMMGIFSLFIILMCIIGFIMLIVFRKGCKLPVSTPAQSRRGVAIAKSSFGIIFTMSIMILYGAVLIISNVE